jgi:hypothetical protein
MQKINKEKMKRNKKASCGRDRLTAGRDRGAGVSGRCTRDHLSIPVIPTIPPWRR